MRAVVLGAGGLGSYVGGVLARVGHDVTLVIRGEHAEAVRSGGLNVHELETSFVVHPDCVATALDVAAVDVLVVSVKAYSLDEVMPQIRHLAERGAVVLPLINGVDATDRMRGAGVDPKRLVEGIAYMTAFLTAPGHTERRAKHHRIVIGSQDGLAAGELPRVAELFRATAIDTPIQDDIAVELWRKMAVVCSLSVICGLTGGGIGAVRAHPLGAEFQANAIGEVLRVGRVRGVPIPADAEAHIGQILDAFPEDFYPSVVHDLKSGRRTEMDWLGCVISRFGRQGGVETPLHDAATCAIRIIEDRGGLRG